MLNRHIVWLIYYKAHGNLFKTTSPSTPLQTLYDSTFYTKHLTQTLHTLEFNDIVGCKRFNGYST